MPYPDVRAPEINNRYSFTLMTLPLQALTAKYGLYKWDVENECLVRDKQGLCVPVKTSEYL